VLAVDDRRPGALEVLAEQRPAFAEREPAQVFVADVGGDRRRRGTL